MPYKLEKSGDGYFVQNRATGRRMSKEALPKKRALAQMAALYANERAAGGKAFAPLKGDAMSNLVMAPDVVAFIHGEGWDISTANQAAALIAGLIHSEVNEPDDLAILATIMRGINEFESSEIDEMEGASQEEPVQMNDGYDPTYGESVVMQSFGKALDLSYVKKLGVVLPGREAALVAVKAYPNSKIMGYTNLWGNVKKLDLEEEFFKQPGDGGAGTDFWDKTLGKSPRPLTYDHGTDPATRDHVVIGKMIDFGDDSIGRWYEAQLDQSHQYRRAVDALIEQGALGTSSDSAPQYVIREKAYQGKAWIKAYGDDAWHDESGKDGPQKSIPAPVFLKQWPLFAAALTTTPCEPRMLDEKSIPEFVKSLGLQLASVAEAHRDGERSVADLVREYDLLSL